MDKILSVFTFLISAATIGSASYATLNLIFAGMAVMGKNDMKREDAKERIAHIVIGYLVCLAAASIVAWLRTA